MTVGTKERGLLAAPEAEALAAARTVAETWGVASVRPCIASIYLEGVVEGDGRQPYAHVIGVEMFDLGVPIPRIGELLRAWNYNVVTPPVADKEIRKVTRRLERPGVWRYSCRNPKLAAYCLGETCPHSTNNGRWEGSAVTPNGLTASGWVAELGAVEVKVFLGLYRLARLKHHGPCGEIPFCFRELERACGVNRRYHTKILRQLEGKNLLAQVTISNMKGQPSTYTFPTNLPSLDIKG